MTTHSQLHSPQPKNSPVVEGDREPQGSEDVARGESSGNHGDTPAGEAALNASAADSSARSAGFEIPIDVVDESPAEEPAAALDEAEADRYAAAFRPSWAPLEGDAYPVISARPSFTPAPVITTREAPAREEAVRFRRKRGAGGWLAAASILSFLGLGYWAISNTIHPSTSTTITSELRPAPTPSQTDTSAIAAADPAPAAPQAILHERPRVGPSLADPESAPAQAAATEAEAAPPEQAAEPPAAAQPEESAAATAPSEPPAKLEATAAPSEPPAKVEAAATPPAPVEAAAKPEPAAKAEPALVQAPPPSAAKPPAPAPAAEHKAVVAAAAPSAATAEPKPVHARDPLLVVRAVPESAQLWLDGARVSNPFEVRLPRGGKHKIDAKSFGFEASSQTVRIESDAKLTIALRRVTPAPEPHLQVRPLSAARTPRGAGFVTTNPY